MDIIDKLSIKMKKLIDTIYHLYPYGEEVDRYMDAEYEPDDDNEESDNDSTSEEEDFIAERKVTRSMTKKKNEEYNERKMVIDISYDSEPEYSEYYYVNEEESSYDYNIARRLGRDYRTFQHPVEVKRDNEMFQRPISAKRCNEIRNSAQEEKKDVRSLTMIQKRRLFRTIYGVDPINSPNASYHCPICMRITEWNYFHVAHIKPRSRRGRMSIKNLLFICWRCNTQMSNKTIFEYIYDERYWDPTKHGLEIGTAPVDETAMNNIRDIMKKTITEFDTNGDFE